jgi:ABC-2 type transport system permease protein
MGLFWIFVFPLIFALFFGFLSGGGERGVGRMSLAVVDQDDSDGSHALVARLEKSDALKLRTLPLAEAQEAVRRGNLTGYVLIPKGYGEAAASFRPDGPALEVGMDPARKAEAGYLEGILTEATYAGLQELFTDPKKSRAQIDQALASLDKAKDMNPEQKKELRHFLGEVDRFMGQADAKVMAGSPFAQAARIKKVSVLPEEDGPRSPFEITFPSAVLWGLIGCIITFAISIVSERTAGTMLRLRVAPLTYGQILGGKGLACYLVSVTVAVVVLALGRLAFGVRIQSPVGLALAVGSAAFCFTGVMMLLATVGKTERAVAGSGWGILMPLTMLGGGMIPLAFLPAWVQTAGSISPVKWGILALEGAIWRGFTLGEMLTPCGILAGIGAVCFVLGVRLLSREGS